MFSENRVVSDTMWKNTGKAALATDDIIRFMRFACWISKSTDTHSESVKLNVFPQYQSSRERA
jgi:uncharacterized protein YegL